MNSNKLAGNIIATLSKSQFNKVTQPKIYNEIITEELMLPCRDGVSLHTFIIRPKGLDENVPLLVERSCYPAMVYCSVKLAKEYCARGYAVAVQASRGTDTSEGSWEPNVNERNDGLDLLNYLSDLPWVGNIGYHGLSYMALTGWTMIDAVPSKVKSMYLNAYGVDRFTSAYSNGMFRHDVLTGWTMQNAGKKLKADYLESCKYRPHLEVDEKLWDIRLDWYRDWISNPDSNSEYWQTGFWGMMKEIPSNVKIPVTIVEGWFDHHLQSALNSYNLLPDSIKDKTILKIGPWNHMQAHAASGHKNEKKNGAAKDLQDKLDWFDLTLKEGKTPSKKIEYFEIGNNKWKTSDSYPFKSNGNIRYYLNQDEKRSLKKTPGIGISNFVYDPNNPVPTIGAESLLTTGKQRGSKLQPQPDYRNDVISFVSDVLSEPLSFLGKIKIHLNVATDAEDTAFCVKVCEVMKDGKAYNLRTVISSLQYQNGVKSKKEYEPNTFVELDMESWDLSWKFQEGSRIRVDITSSDFPQYAIHPNKKELWCTVNESIIANQKINCEKSYIEFPTN